MLFVGLAFQQIASSQPTEGSPAVSVDSNQPITLRAVTESNSMSTATAPAVSMAATNETATVQSTNEAAADTNTAVVLPPIVFQDVPLTTAVEALAREANINYLMDPAIGYGQPGQNQSEPNVSVRWENVTYQQALIALLDNYGLQMVENPRTKIFKITKKDPTAPPPLITRVVQLKYAGTTNMIEAVASGLIDKRSHVMADARTSQLIVIATDQEQAATDSLIAQLDKPTRQVLIETRIVELSSNPQTEKGIDWSGTFGGQSIVAGNTSTFLVPPTLVTTTNGSTIVPGLANGVVGTPGVIGSTEGGFGRQWFLNADGVHAVLSFLNSDSDAQVVSMPRIVTLDNEMATINVTRSFPVFNTTAGTQGSPGGSQVTYSNLGTILEVTPRISANDTIWLKVRPTVSSFFGTVSKTVSGLVNQADEFDTRSIDTQVLIPNAHTLVMGGLVKDNPNAQYNKIPILGDIPLIGLAFRHEAKTLEKDNLLLFITPTIVKDSDFKATTSVFLDSEPRLMKDPMNPKSAWDSATPRGDWSNPLPSTVR